MATAKKTAKRSAKKAPSKKAAGRKYSPAASASVEREMKAMKQGKLTIGKSGKKVTNPKQAIAIGLSEARREGDELPPDPRAKKSSGKSSSSAKKAAKKPAAKKTGAKKSSAKKSASKKSAAKRSSKS